MSFEDEASSFAYMCRTVPRKVSTSKMGMLYGIAGMICLIVGFWSDDTYTYSDGRWLIAVSMLPGILFGLWSAMSVEITGLPELVGAYNGFGGLAAALEGMFCRIIEPSFPLIWV